MIKQDAWFYTVYIDHAPQCVSAVLYQIGNDQPDLLKSMLYEQGLIPLIKPIVFNALVWIVLRQPKKRLATVGILAAYLNHCLKICKQGASARNIDNYAFSLAYAHISEVRPILKRIYNEVESLLFLYQPVLHVLHRAFALEVELYVVQGISYFLEWSIRVEIGITRRQDRADVA